MTMNGTETSTLVAGRWLVTEFRGEMMGMTFEGRGISGWDPAKKEEQGTDGGTWPTADTRVVKVFGPTAPPSRS